MSDSQSNQELQQQNKQLEERVQLLEGELKPSIPVAVLVSIIVFALLFMLPLAMIYIVPKFEQIFKDMLGKEERLPYITELVLNISHMFRDNTIITLPLFLILSLVSAGFMGFGKFFLSPPICRLIEILFICFLGLIVVCLVIAMFLPLIVLMDKLGSQ